MQYVKTYLWKCNATEKFYNKTIIVQTDRKKKDWRHIISTVLPHRVDKIHISLLLYNIFQISANDWIILRVDMIYEIQIPGLPLPFPFTMVPVDLVLVHAVDDLDFTVYPDVPNKVQGADIAKNSKYHKDTSTSHYYVRNPILILARQRPLVLDSRSWVYFQVIPKLVKFVLVDCVVTVAGSSVGGCIRWRRWTINESHNSFCEWC